MGRQHGLMIHRESHTGDAAHSVCVSVCLHAHAYTSKNCAGSDSCTDTLPIKWGEINVPSHFISCFTFSLHDCHTARFVWQLRE